MSGVKFWTETLLDSPSSVYRYQFLDFVEEECGEGTTRLSILNRQAKEAKKKLDDWDNTKDKAHGQLLAYSAYPYKAILAIYSWLTRGVTQFISALASMLWFAGSLAFYGLKCMSAFPLRPILNAMRNAMPAQLKGIFTPPWRRDRSTFSYHIAAPFMIFSQMWGLAKSKYGVHADRDRSFLGYVWLFLCAFFQTPFVILFLVVNLAEGVFNLGCGLLVFVPKLVHDGLIFLADVFIVGRPLGLKYQSLLSVALLAMTFYFAFFGTAAILPAFLAGAIGFIVSYLLNSRLPGGVTPLGCSIFNTGLWALATAAIVLMVCSPQLLLAVPVAIKAVLLPSVSTPVFSWLFATSSVGVFTALMSAFVISPLSECLLCCCCGCRAYVTDGEAVLEEEGTRPSHPLPVLEKQSASRSCCSFSLLARLSSIFSPPPSEAVQGISSNENELLVVPHGPGSS